jgi:4-hydroxythreonine-4-phosphate dehydrogenase
MPDRVVDLACVSANEVVPGQVSAACGTAAYRCVEAALREVRAGSVAGLVTAPLNKQALHLAGIPHPGHTEILAALTGTRRYCMTLASDRITTSLVTTHTSLASVPGTLNTTAILEVIRLTAAAMWRLRGRPPRLAVCALNPHGGENGLFGDEESRHIAPAVAQARAEDLDIEGPLAPDTAFLPSRLDRTDAYICMYHDQGLIPFKMLAFETGVNITLGLPIVRTSPDHGTAFDIAWTGKANPGSMRQAILYAARLAGR